MHNPRGFFYFITAVALVASSFPIPVFSETKEELQSQLTQIEAQISQYETELAKTKTEKQTLTNKINQLKKEQSKVTLQIRQVSLQITQLGQKLSVTEQSIQATTDRLARAKNQTAVILQALSEQDHKPLILTLLEAKSLATFFDELNSLEKISESLVASVNQVKIAKADLESEHQDLESQQNEKKNFLSIQGLQQKALADKAAEQNTILKETQGKEANYQTLLKESQKKAKEIRSRIYELVEVGAQITFGEAVKIANSTSALTGVRPAFLLAVLTQESDLGKNVGTCNRAGDPLSKSWRNIMKSSRDQEPFLTITKELGMNPDTTPVSCPMKDSRGNQVGWGGAMGPAQFIPSTWMLYKDRVSAITGKPANPWDIRDAFLASALLLKDNGATSGAGNAEWKAAMLYFSGSTNNQFRFYGDSILAIASRYEGDIRALG